MLFADLAGFTPLSASHPPETLVRLLDALFSEMDALAHRVGAEKIKTIGDCYMVVAGRRVRIPIPSPHSLIWRWGCRRRRLARSSGCDSPSPELPAELPLRVGLHVGPVVAGVPGKQKLAYDLWGDTVNIASRMESHGVVGRIQCTEQVVQALADRYCFKRAARSTCAARGRSPRFSALAQGHRAGFPSSSRRGVRGRCGQRQIEVVSDDLEACTQPCRQPLHAGPHLFAGSSRGRHRRDGVMRRNLGHHRSELHRDRCGAARAGSADAARRSAAGSCGIGKQEVA